jgi:hypothetical protein
MGFEVVEEVVEEVVVGMVERVGGARVVSRAGAPGGA